MGTKIIISILLAMLAISILGFVITNNSNQQSQSVALRNYSQSNNSIAQNYSSKQNSTQSSVNSSKLLFAETP